MTTQLVGEYELLDYIAAGTVGDVYRARHHESGQIVVIKFLQADLAGEPELQRRFVREVAIAEKLNHPNIVRHLDCGLHEDRIYFAMELVECGTLKDVLKRRGRLPWRDAVECAIQVCAALDYAHEKGVIHRDLKPTNLFLSERGIVKVGDFGLARDLNSVRLTMDGQTVGTSRYMPPEQIAGEAELTGATDLYALGCVVYEMLTGNTPFDGQSIIEIFESHLYEEPTPPAEVVHDCPADLSELIMQLLAKRPLERPTTAAAVQSALHEMLHGRSTESMPRTGQAMTADLAAASTADAPNLTQRLHASVEPAFTREAANSSTLIAAAIAGIVLLAAAVVWLLF